MKHKEKTRPAGKKKSSKSTGKGENDDAASVGKASGTSSSKRKKRRSASNGSREKAHKPTPDFTNKVFLPRKDSEGDREGVALPDDSGDVSSNGAPSTEEENKDGATSDLSGSEGSQSELVRL